MDENIENSDLRTKGSLMEGLKKYISKIPPKTKVKILLLLVVIAVIVVVYKNFFTTDISEKVTTTTSSKYSYYVSSLDYCKELEQKLKNVLSNISGVGNVEVMITLDSSMELVFAQSTESKGENSIFTSSSSDSYGVEVSSPLIIETNGNEEPLVVKEILPKVKGVLVVCSGASEVSTKLDIMHAVQSLLGINISNIQVLSNS